MLSLEKVNLRREVRAGLTTFMTMAYIAAVNPLILADAGVPRDGALAATCLAAALGSILMGVLANYPFALAPGMGLNAFFAYTVVLGSGMSWQGALAVVFLSGAIFFLLTVTRLREAIINGIPLGLKWAVSVGIGFFIALIGLKNAGLIVFHSATNSMGLVDASYFSEPDLHALLPLGTSRESVWLAIFGLALTAIMVVRQVRGALLWGILATWVAGLAVGVFPWSGQVLGLPSGLDRTVGALDFAAVLSYGVLTVVFTFTFVDLFDTAGTLVGVAGQSGMLDRRGHLPRARQALLADSLATMGGALLGTSTTTTYIESAAGISEGGRTGWTSITVGLLFLATLFFTPLVNSIPAAATAPALIMVGVFMMGPVRRIDFADYKEAIPAFLTIAIMPLAFSIAEGIVAGILAFVLLRLAAGRWREVGWTLWVLSGLFVLRFFVV